jgi:hypothetical protein
MKDLIRTVLREDAEMTEMGISLGKIKASQPKNYLVKALASKEKEAQSKNELKKISQKANELYSDIDKDLKNLDWKEISFIEQKEFFYFELPVSIKRKMEKLCSIYEELKSYRYTSALTSKVKIDTMCNDYTDVISVDHIYLYIDQPRNRTHFPQGLPPSLLGYNLGFKLYRKLLNILGFMISEENATAEVQGIYRKLIQLPDINCIIYKDSVLIMEDDLPKDKVIEIVAESIYERYFDMKSQKKLVLNRSILVNSKLLRVIGETRLLNMMDELFYLAKDGDKIPFETIGYKTKD